MRKRGRGMVIGREQSLAAALDLVHAGVSVDVVGGRGSGRSAFLRALRARLEEGEWKVIQVRGVASLRQHPLAALHLAGIPPTGTQRSTSGLHETAEALRHALRLPRSVLFLDDWDDLDESSWGVAEAVRRSSGIPIVLSRLQGLRARHTPTGLAASTLEPSYVIDMSPLRFEEMEKALEHYLKGPIEAATMSRIFAKSGGNIGLALSLVDACIREQRIALRGGKEWVATRDLWSSGLRAVLEAHLEDLDDAARDAIEIIAIVGVADIETVRKLIDWGTLELLEERRMITFISSGARQLVTVVPPLIVEFFRHEPLTARRTRLTALIVERLGTAGSASAILAERENRQPTFGTQEALFVRLLQERARARRIVTASEWEANPSASSAVRYLRALMHTHTPTVTETVRHVFDTTDASNGDVAGRADFESLRAEWTAYVDHDLDGAQRRLSEASITLGPYARMLDAVDVRLQANLTRIPDDFGARLEVTDDLPDDVKLQLWETQMLVLVSTGRFSDALRVHTATETVERPRDAYMIRVLHGLALLGIGSHRAALETLQQGFDEAHGYLDIDALRAFGAAVILVQLLAGDYAAVDEIVETVFAAGEPSPLPPGVQLSLLTIASVVAIRRGQLSLGEKIAQEINGSSILDGPLPGQTHAWPRAQLLAFDGKVQAAADDMWASSQSLWDRGARFAAVLGMLSSLELAPVGERLAVARRALDELPDARLLQAHGDYVSALAEGDPVTMLACVEELEQVGLVGLALSACQIARTTALERGDDATRRAADSAAHAIRAAHGDRAFDTARFGAAAVTLTEREREVGRFAAMGLSNQEIATRLVLSVRTVESHMHRIMRKLDVSNRKALAQHVEVLS
ncbi:LuxR C-terminal-related transcriptional regulator [Microbacterium sp. KSW4-16]|uniref:helix-turn-helix transcriptional regulator n=1 Tax=Microbacterium aurugineum TaxID=2851642 RepID=UPI0020BDECF8|nr:LuxR C-terminal-related transcriptional regulator [Microbacterium aurugineum]MCK8467835.1 LuxR C-terminal-related transcriptional regulator [Microbacterium aurugineum]